MRRSSWTVTSLGFRSATGGLGSVRSNAAMAGRELMSIKASKRDRGTGMKSGAAQLGRREDEATRAGGETVGQDRVFLFHGQGIGAALGGALRQFGADHVDVAVAHEEQGAALGGDRIE